MENDTDRDRVSYAGRVIEYEIRRSSGRRKTIQVKVRDGEVRVAAPEAASDDYLRRFMLSKAPWIMRSVNPPSPPPTGARRQRFADGETLPYLGKDYPMLTFPPRPPEPAVSLDREEGIFRIAVPPGEMDGLAYERVSKAVMDWYAERAGAYLTERVESWWPRYGTGQPSRVLVKNPRSQWGSCARDGTLRFNWRLMMLPPEVTDLVVVHELAHLRVRNHSPDFWKLVEEGIPDYKPLRKRLRELQKTLTM